MTPLGRARAKLKAYRRYVELRHAKWVKNVLTRYT